MLKYKNGKIVDIGLYIVIHKRGGILYFDKSLRKCQDWVLDNGYFAEVEYKWMEVE